MSRKFKQAIKHTMQSKLRKHLSAGVVDRVIVVRDQRRKLVNIRFVVLETTTLPPALVALVSALSALTSP